MKFAIVLGLVLIICMSATAYLAYQEGHYSGLKELCPEGKLYYDLKDNSKILCLDNETDLTSPMYLNFEGLIDNEK